MKPHEDWVHESWTVDCVCGVNFDDGKEMVDCDECGIWVHTWCSRYVKGDDLFVCHKCKIKNNDNDVSKLVVTSKSLKMGNSSSQNQMLFPLKPCLEIPIEDRVHVNGVPGGDLGLFECVSTVFSRQLWKCCGYVPKKFRFQYSEFPCCDEKENVGHQEGNNVDDDKGTNVNNEKSLVCDLSRNKGRKESRGEFEDRVKKKVRVVDKEEEEDEIRRL
ncbi:PHD finger protein [Cardamine amara subsp. amara]|uniref:PHD finger protein n=1 Tax=Cardamine amara subsp. amara TaxID=228776 RepID=A0ABD0ZB43_CARAN